MEKRPIVIIDGFNVFVRHFVVNESVTSTGEPCGGVVGFLKFLYWVTNNIVPSKLYIVWEQGGGSPRRKKIYPEYKANRAKLSGEFSTLSKDPKALPSKRWIKDDQENKKKQILQLVDACKNLPVCQLYVPDCECDDIIAYLAKNKLANEDAKRIIVSSDKDFYQLLLDKQTMIYDPGKHMYIDGDNISKTYAISPRNFVLARTLVGDESDNVTGVPGVGLKTAVKRFSELADPEKDLNVDMILEICRNKLNENSKVKVYKAVLECEELIKRNWSIMYLDSSDLSAQQINKVNFVVENFQPKMDKLGLIKCLLSAGIVTDLDFDRIAHQMRISLLTS